jgi:hypothetical protein
MTTPRAASKKVVVGERLALFNYYKVDKIDAEDIHCTDENGQTLRISHSIVDNSMVSTTQYTESKKVTRSELARRIETFGHAPFQVKFNKQVQANTVADGLDKEDLSSQAKRRKLVSKLMKGEERIMHARLWRSAEDENEIELGRFKVVDLEASTPGHPAQRLVDTRTVQEVVSEGVRYYV